MSPRRVKILRRAYETSSLVDQSTLIMSAAIKKHVEIWGRKLTENMLLNPDEKTSLISRLLRWLYPDLSTSIKTTISEGKMQRDFTQFRRKKD